MKPNWNLNYLWDHLSTSLLAGTHSLGVYLSAHGLSLAHVQKGLGGLQVKDLAFLPLEAKPEDLAAELQDMIVDYGLESCPVGLAVSSEIGFFRQMSLPKAAAENLAQVVAYELDRFLPLPADKLYFDFQVLGETADEIRLILMALPREAVEPYIILLNSVGLKPMSLEVAPIAAANSFAVLGGKLPQSWLLVHLDAGNLELTHIQGQTLRSFSQKSGVPPKSLSRVIQAEMDHVEAGAPLPRAICLYGQGEDKFKSAALGKWPELELIYPDRFSIKGMLPETRVPGAVPAVGAALRGLGKVPVAANLLQPSERAAVNLRGFSATKLLLLVFIGLCLLWAGSALIHQRVVLYQVNRQIAALAPEAKQVERQLDESRSLAKQMGNLRKVGQSPDKLRILKDLTTLIPDNTWLFNLHLSKQTLDISGMSRSASDLIPLLEKSGWLQKTEFASPIVTDANKLEHFKIKAEIKGLEPGS